MPELPKHVRVAQKAALFKRVFDTEDGKQALAECKAFACLNDTTVMVSPESRMLDPYATIYNEGKRALLLHIMKLTGLQWEDIAWVKTLEEREHKRDMEHEAFSS